MKAEHKSSPSHMVAALWNRSKQTNPHLERVDAVRQVGDVNPLAVVVVKVGVLTAGTNTWSWNALRSKRERIFEQLEKKALIVLAKEASLGGEEKICFVRRKWTAWRSVIPASGCFFEDRENEEKHSV